MQKAKNSPPAAYVVSESKVRGDRASKTHSFTWPDILAAIGAEAPPPTRRPTLPRSLDIEYDVDRPGGTYKAYELAPDDGPEVCRDECLDDAGCKAWSYKKKEFSDYAGPICYRKDRVPARQLSECCHSGVTAEPEPLQTGEGLVFTDVAIRGDSRIETKWLDENAPPQACRDFCLKTPFCVVWQYRKPTSDDPHTVCRIFESVSDDKPVCDFDERYVSGAIDRSVVAA